MDVSHNILETHFDDGTSVLVTDKCACRSHQLGEVGRSRRKLCNSGCHWLDTQFDDLTQIAKVLGARRPPFEDQHRKNSISRPRNPCQMIRFVYLPDTFLQKWANGGLGSKRAVADDSPKILRYAPSTSPCRLEYLTYSG